MSTTVPTTDATPAIDAADVAPATDAADPAPRPGAIARLRLRVRRFRRTRPFWGALVLIAGGYLIAKPLLGGSMEFYTTVGTRGIMPLVLGGGMIAAALTAVVVPAQRHFPAIIATMFAVASLPMANLGGWVIGMVLGIVGAGMVFAWTPYTDAQLARFAEKDARRAARRARRTR